jgi:hypothetical protein
VHVVVADLPQSDVNVGVNVGVTVDRLDASSCSLAPHCAPSYCNGTGVSVSVGDKLCRTTDGCITLDQVVEWTAWPMRRTISDVSTTLTNSVSTGYAVFWPHGEERFCVPNEPAVGACFAQERAPSRKESRSMIHGGPSARACPLRRTGALSTLAL